jgi:tetrahydromethanopterin S-methyltransferase subunit G
MINFLDSNGFKATAFFLVFIMAIVGSLPRVEAGFVTSADIYSAMDRENDLSAVQSRLENKMVVKRLQEFGYSADEVQDRLAQLSGEEMHNLASQIGSIDVAGDGIGAVIGVLLIVLLVVVILKLTNKSITIS